MAKTETMCGLIHVVRVADVGWLWRIHVTRKWRPILGTICQPYHREPFPTKEKAVLAAKRVAKKLDLEIHDYS